MTVTSLSALLRAPQKRFSRIIFERCTYANLQTTKHTRILLLVQRGGALGVKKIDLDLIERSRKVSHFSLQATHPESSSERVLTARRYPKLGDQRFESTPLVTVGGRACGFGRRPSAPVTKKGVLRKYDKSMPCRQIGFHADR